MGQKEVQRLPQVHNLSESENSKDGKEDENYELLVFDNRQPESAHGVSLWENG